MVLGRVDDHVALLAAIASNQRRTGIRSIEDVDGVQRAANQTTVKCLDNNNNKKGAILGERLDTIQHSNNSFESTEKKKKRKEE